jgi:hypothetical protein
MWKQNQCWRAKVEALPVNGLMESDMNIRAARFGSIHHGRVRGHWERAFVHHTPTVAPLSQHVLCVRRV